MVLIIFIKSVGSATAATFIVNSIENNPDSMIGDGACADVFGNCTLWAAIEETNNIPGLDEINFNIGNDTNTIQPIHALPEISSPVIIDGYSELSATEATEENAANLSIELDGRYCLNGVSGLVFVEGSDESIVRGLAINNFEAWGIQISSSNNNIISGNFIGTDISGTFISKNENEGIEITNNSSSNIVGGSYPAARNINSGNGGGGGVTIEGEGSNYNIVRGNYIGTNVTGIQDLGNIDAGVRIQGGASYNIIEDNLISGNGHDGIYITEPGTTGNIVIGNLIGTDVTGTQDLGNDYDGIAINYGSHDNRVGGTTPEERNVISGNDEASIMVDDGHNNTIIGNNIGVDITGNNYLPNDTGIGLQNYSSHNIIGGSIQDDYNIILDGISITTGENIISGNNIGLNAFDECIIDNNSYITIENAEVHFIDADLMKCLDIDINILNSQIHMKNTIFSVYNIFQEANSRINVYYKARIYLSPLFHDSFYPVNFKLFNELDQVVYSGGINQRTGYSEFSDYLYSYNIGSDHDPQEYKLRIYKNGRLKYQEEIQIIEPNQTIGVDFVIKPARIRMLNDIKFKIY